MERRRAFSAEPARAGRAKQGHDAAAAQVRREGSSNLARDRPHQVDPALRLRDAAGQACFSMQLAEGLCG